MPEETRSRVLDLETKATALLKRQFALAEDLDAEAEYLAVVDEAAATHAEIDRLNSLLLPAKEVNAKPPVAAAPALVVFEVASREPAPEPPTAPPPSPGPMDHLRQQIQDLKEQAAAAQLRQYQLAEKSVTDNSAVAEYNAVADELATLSGDIARLSVALTSIETRAANEAAAGHAAEGAALRQRVVAMLDESLEAARSFEVSLGAAVRAFRSLIAIRERAWNAWPGPPPIGLSLVGGEIIKLIAAEMYRQSPSPPLTGGATRRGMLALPAPKSPRLELLDQPERIASLVSEIEQANAAAKQALEGVSK
jgi:hypothetical protein